MPLRNLISTGARSEGLGSAVHAAAGDRAARAAKAATEATVDRAATAPRPTKAGANPISPPPSSPATTTDAHPSYPPDPASTWPLLARARRTVPADELQDDELKNGRPARDRPALQVGAAGEFEL